MSHYTKIATQIVDPPALLKALADMGYKNVEVHKSAQGLYGYLGDQRPEKAHIIIRRKHISKDSNDIGFVRTESGAYQAIVSEYDQQLLGAHWVATVCQKYAYHAVVEKLQEQGFNVDSQEVDKATNKIRLVLKRS